MNEHRLETERVNMKKWHWGGFFGCLIGGIVLLCAMSYAVAVLASVLSSPFTGTETLMVGALLFLLIAVAGLLTGLACQGSCIDELELRIRKLEEKLKEKPEEE